MNVKKYFQQKADEEFSSVLSESEKEYCRQLEEKYQGGRQAVRVKRRNWALISCSVVVLIAAIITISIVFAPKKPPIFYQDENRVSVASNISDLNNDLKFGNVSFPEANKLAISMSYDNKSGDKLFYEVKLDDGFESSSITFVINDNYSFDFPISSNVEVKEKPLDGYLINYTVTRNMSAMGADFDATYSAWIKLNTETVFITYTQTPALGDEYFFQYVQSIITLK